MSSRPDMGSRGLILNVDDIAPNRYARSHVLRKAGYTVIEAGSGADALRLVREEMPHLVLCDVQLPDISGLEVCRRIKADPILRLIPVVQISATFVEDSDEAQGLESGAEIYLTEPLEPRELETVVDVLLRLHRSETGLRETEVRWQRFVDSNIVGVVMVDDDRIVEANDAFLDMVGYTRDDLREGSLTWRSLTPPEQLDTGESARTRILDQGFSATFEKDYLRKDGSRISAVVGAAALDRERRRWMSFVLDISTRKRAEAEREDAFRNEHAARMQAEEATRLKDEFLANLSHELRTPMNIIIGWIHLLRTGGLGEEQKTRALDAIGRAARSQAQLIEDLLDVSRIVTGKFRLTMLTVDLSPVLSAAVESLRLAAQARQITLRTPPRVEGAKVRGDADRLQQVFWNLLSNAVKFTPSGGTVDIRLEIVDRLARISVSDTGVGIAKEFLPFVFDRFRQADGTSTREFMGMGLGLAIVRHVAELHGGYVEATSEGVGQGATFTVWIPLLSDDLEDDQRTAPPSRGRRTDGAPIGAGRRILLIDDEPDARELVSASLSKLGFELTTVGTAQEALRLLDHWQPHMILSDIGMPGMDGYAFIRQLRARPPSSGGRVPAIALTAFARDEDASRALATGYQHHVSKPIDRDELVDAIVKLASPRGDSA